MANHASRALQDKEGRKEGKIIKIANHFLYYTAMTEFDYDFVIGYLGSYFILGATKFSRRYILY